MTVNLLSTALAPTENMFCQYLDTTPTENMFAHILRRRGLFLQLEQGVGRVDELTEDSKLFDNKIHFNPLTLYHTKGKSTSQRGG